MAALRDIPIKRKLTLISVLAGGIAIVVTSLAFVTHEQFVFRRTMVRDLSILAEMLGFNSAAALSFDDSRSAEQVLQSLTAQPHIVAACVYDNAGRVFASYQRAGAAVGDWPAPQPDGEYFRPGEVWLFRAITLQKEVVGRIHIVSDLEEMTARMQSYAVIAMWVAVAATLLAYLIAATLQRVISAPISRLANVVGLVAATKDYSVRVEKSANDELGRLMDGFNEMLTQLQARDAALQQARDELEKRVAERTHELRRENEERVKFFALVENSMDFIGMVSLEGQPLYLNPAGRRLVGLDDRADMQAMRWQSFFDESTRRLRRDVIAPTVFRTGRWEGESRLLHQQTNGLIEVYAQLFLVRHPETNEPLCVATVQRDITERKRADAELERVHRQLLVVSREAGMAEVATDVLHNVGNVLNSVNVSATLAVDRIRASKTGYLARLGEMLQQNQADLATYLAQDARGREIPGYLLLLAGELATEHSDIVRELTHLHANIEHIKEIVAMQQSYAKVSGVIETVPLTDLLEDAARINAAAMARHGITLTRDYEAQPVVAVERHKVLQILVNLIRNAELACKESNRPDKLVTLRLRQNGAVVKIAVVDNGVGIRPENLTRIFSHGFTTRKDGHGFGLHSGAIVARELGGTLRAHSDGPGLGAMFTFELPITTGATP